MFHHKTKCNIAHYNFHCLHVKESARDRIQSDYVTFQANAQQNKQFLLTYSKLQDLG